jgi:hypothetical protein
MNKIFMFFVLATAYSKQIVISIILFLLITSSCFGVWLYLDYQEVRLRNQVLAQQEVVKIYENSQIEKQRLVEYKREYNNFRQSWLMSLIFKHRTYLDTEG